MNLPGVIGAGEPAASVFALARPACGSSRVNWLIGKDGPCPEIIFKENTIMGLLDSVVSAVGGSDPQMSGQAGLLPARIEQVNKYPGGLAGLIEKFQENGRASCRERVCQYAKISGVTEPIKKKKAQTKEKKV